MNETKVARGLVWFSIGLGLAGIAAGLFGYSHMLGTYSGGQAEAPRVPCADVGPVKIPDGLPDEKVVFLSDIFPTGYMAAEQAHIEPGDAVAVWGCGPVAQFAICSAWMLGAGRVIAVDRLLERLEMARRGKTETSNFEEEDVYDALKEMTKGRGPDRCIDAVGAVLDKTKASVGLATDRPAALRDAIICCCKGGTVSIPGVSIGFPDKVPMGAAMNKALTFKMGQTHVQKYKEQLLKTILDGEIGPSFVITHEVPLEKGPEMDKTFRDKQDGCIKVVLKP